MKDMKEWATRFVKGGISRREFVERAAGGGVSVLAASRTLVAQQRHAQIVGHANQTNVNPYEEWLKKEGIPVYRDYAIKNLRAIELGSWARLGARGAYIDLKGGEGVNDGYVCEIEPGKSTAAQRYLFEEIVYILSGEGETEIWLPGGAKQAVKWQAGSIIGPPVNAWRQHFNRGAAPARFVAMTNAPVVIDLFHNDDFVFNNDFVFRDRYTGQPDFFGTGPEHLRHKDTTSEDSEQKGGVYTWDSGFVPNARTMALAPLEVRGQGNSRVELQIAENTLQAHISEFEVGTYKKAHRHGPGSYVVMLNGAGFSLMWKDALKYSDSKSQVRVDWEEGSVFVPPDGWFHQHFNSSGEPARYLAATWGGDGKWFMRSLGGGGRTHRLGKTSTRVGGNLIEYEDEDPAIREMFATELKKSGVPMKMKSKKDKKA
jgi:quercetin dioxygenase-like cupin family protein